MGKRRKGLGPNQVDFEGRGRRMCLREGDASACWHGGAQWTRRRVGRKGKLTR